MFRRRFSSGLRLGLLVGIGVSAARALQGRRARAMPSPGSWAPMTPSAEGPGPVPATPSASSAPAPSTPPARPVDEVGEQIMEPAAVTEPSPGAGVNPSPTPAQPEPGSSDGDLGAPAGTPPERELLAPDIEPVDDDDQGSKR